MIFFFSNDLYFGHPKHFLRKWRNGTAILHSLFLGLRLGVGLGGDYNTVWHIAIRSLNILISSQNSSLKILSKGLLKDCSAFMFYILKRTHILKNIGWKLDANCKESQSLVHMNFIHNIYQMYDFPVKLKNDGRSQHLAWNAFISTNLHVSKNNNYNHWQKHMDGSYMSDLTRK